jgi:hypothetical protein
MMSFPLGETSVEIRPGGDVEDRLLTDIAVALERIGVLGTWVTDQGPGRSTYEVESGGNICHVHVEVVRRVGESAVRS